MALPHLVKLTMYFKYQETGWTESHILMTAPTGTPRPIYGARQQATNLAVLRANFLGWGPLLYRVKLSWLDVWRDSIYADPPAINTGTGSPQPTGVPYYNTNPSVGMVGDPWDVASFRIEETENYRGEEPISGMPDGLLSQTLSFPFPTPYTAYSTAAQLYFNTLCGTTGPGMPSAGGPWGTLVRLKSPDGPADSDITSVAYTAGPPFGWVFTTVGALGLQQGDAVRVLGISQPPNLPRTKFNGTWNVLNPTAFTFTVAYAQAGPSYVGLCGDATAQLIVLGAQAYTSWNFDGTTHRKRGVPSDRPHGRRKRSVPTAAV